MQSAIALVLSGDCSTENVLCRQVRESLKDVKASAADVTAALSTLNVDNSHHIAALLVIIGNHLSRTKTSALDAAFVVKTATGLVGTVGLSPAAARAAKSEVRVIGEALRDALDGLPTDAAAFDGAMGFFKNFINMLADTKSSRVMVLTPLHPLVLETCIRRNRFEVARAFLTAFTQVVRLEPALTGSTVLDHLTFWYLSGQVLLYLRDFERARTSYFVCLTTPASVSSALAVAAAMKHAFCSMLLLEAAEHCPSAAPTQVSSVIGDDDHAYFRDVVDAYNRRNINEYKSCVAARDRRLRDACNLGLAQSVVLSMRRRVVKEMPAVFSRVTLEQVRKDAGIDDVAEARRLVADMIAGGVLAATLLPAAAAGAGAGGDDDGDDEVVEFAAANDAGAEARLHATIARYAEAVREMKEFQNILEGIRVDTAVPVQVASALQKQQQQQRAGGGGGGGAEGGAGMSVEERNVQVALAASVFDS
jgi:hypothetical protein